MDVSSQLDLRSIYLDVKRNAAPVQKSAVPYSSRERRLPSRSRKTGEHRGLPGLPGIYETRGDFHTQPAGARPTSQMAESAAGCDAGVSSAIVPPSYVGRWTSAIMCATRLRTHPFILHRIQRIHTYTRSHSLTHSHTHIHIHTTTHTPYHISR